MFAAFAPGGDVKRYLRGRMPRIILLITILTPILYGAGAVAAVWNPKNITQNVSVAVVNLDRGAKAMGTDLDAGKQVTKALVDSHQLDLSVVDAAKAEKGVTDGKYYFSITIPENFSESLLSPMKFDAHQAQMVFTYNAANNYLMTMIGKSAAQQIVTTVSTTIGTQTFDVALKDVSKLEPKIRQAATGVNKLNDGMQEAHTASGKLAAALGGIDQAVVRVATPLEAALKKAPTVNGQALGAAADQLGRDADSLAQVLDRPARGQSQAVQTITGVIAQLRATGDPMQHRLADTLEGAKGFLLAPPAGGADPSQLQRVRDNSKLIAGELSDPHSQVRTVMTMLTDGNLPGDVAKLQGAAGELASGSGELHAGLGKLAQGTGQLAGIVDGAIKQLPTLSPQEADAIAKSLADPVTMKSDTHHKNITLGESLVPPMFTLALFMGAILAWMLFSAIQKRPITFGLGGFRSVLASAAPVFWVGAAQALVLYLVVIGIGLRPEHWVGTFAFMLLVVVMAQAFIQMIYAILGAGIGRVFSLGLLMILFLLAGGLIPLKILGKDLGFLHIFDPLAYPVQGLKQLTMGGVDHRLWISIGIIVAVTAVCWLISSLIAHRDRRFTIFRLYPTIAT
ncbi:MAG TPA: YhgE/Pip domain-containing protein [Gordonia sp. (in: high G+C Gram-positive bacteria)]|uniref:YhgE/Pip family protein n=1 Tax=unclassified Gordonia (in: high G+C Gram-positive bacteria) TaxID=2657482 RepID=UPI000FA125DC|nr:MULTISPECIES: YhgE/Pip domain-containing protein [unclassified Gordonia (in: high G+C Gram-positive bacteria)]RUP37840.1 MAG: DUF3533 domain-containing protein [Gordonia sp. (in: high G+C Gram-positive bacteria)]HNP57645.1 YhgE/Pip domain-containing protein [Gordonia sp. (in: high G+C Gram-positive bacteria)]HRC50710.1 YhgE/Pip domain-containing protein [Gordonia sp. (in: high G+C Gram-positive bacteria)]